MNGGPVCRSVTPDTGINPNRPTFRQLVGRTVSDTGHDLTLFVQPPPQGSHPSVVSVKPSCGYRPLVFDLRRSGIIDYSGRVLEMVDVDGSTPAWAFRQTQQPTRLPERSKFWSVVLSLPFPPVQSREDTGRPVTQNINLWSLVRLLGSGVSTLEHCRGVGSFYTKLANAAEEKFIDDPRLELVALVALSRSRHLGSLPHGCTSDPGNPPSSPLHEEWISINLKDLIQRLGTLGHGLETRILEERTESGQARFRNRRHSVSSWPMCNIY